MADATWRISWFKELGGMDSVTTTSLDRAQDVVLDLLRRHVEFRVTVHVPGAGRKRKG